MKAKGQGEESKHIEEYHSGEVKDMHTHHSEEAKSLHHKANAPHGDVKTNLDHHFYGHFSPKGLGGGIKTSVIRHKAGGY